MSELKKSVVYLLNKLFHDEQVDCMNLQAILSLMMEVDEPALIENAESLAVIMKALESRRMLADIASADFYKLRGAFESRKDYRAFGIGH